MKPIKLIASLSAYKLVGLWMRFGGSAAIDAGSVYSLSIDARNAGAEARLTKAKGGREQKTWATWDDADSVLPLIDLNRLPLNMWGLCLNSEDELANLLGGIHFRYPCRVGWLPSTRFYSRNNRGTAMHQSYLAIYENLTIEKTIKRFLKGKLPLLLTTSFNPGGLPPARDLETALDYAEKLGVMFVVYDPSISSDVRKGSFPAISMTEDGVLEVVRKSGDISIVLNELRNAGYAVRL
ncbi:hypothetical protein A2415_01910 [candidate division WWE3 bacterium RIFOXYC1_FULL_39_7]|uniref:YrdC-like domain-containing protein n=1 Tax=candidate division WWE3 bacterium RIFOXYC1_FULL_39_7 TaxID=1802643 RepID=A0A1F4WH67_UNCKA|nr:MAG: hypothetical protein A2415_01910 [candidate division WWE3 bacterium RIFOXYC1_FULL_39_7]